MRSNCLGDEALNLLLVRHIHHSRRGNAAPARDHAGGLGTTISVDVADHHARPALGERERGRPADPRRTSRTQPAKRHVPEYRAEPPRVQPSPPHDAGGNEP